MNKLLLLFIAAFTSYSISAQDPGFNCGNGRYVSNVFAGVTKTTGITFGVNNRIDYSTSATYPVTLQMDFYEPTGDPAVKRPLVILLFGGAFVQGQRSDMDAICTSLAMKGYAAATIDYRILYPSQNNYFKVFTDPALLTDVVVKAAADVKAAVRFFKHNAATTNTYKIDPTKIIVGGASSGSIATLHAAYVDDIAEFPAAAVQYAANGGIEGNTDLPAPNNLLPTYNATGIAAVLNIAGGIGDTTLIDANDPPVYSSQGTADEVVPYGYGAIKYGFFSSNSYLYGSSLIAERADNLGINNELYPIVGGNHASPGDLPNLLKILTDVSDFLGPIVCSSTLPVTLTNFRVQSENCMPVLRWQTATEQLSSHYDIETSYDGSRFSKVATVKSRNAANGADYTYSLKGYNQAAWFRLKMADKDGRFTYSTVQKFSPSCVATLRLFPNPAQSQATITGLQVGMQVQLLSIEGKLLWSQKATGNTMEIALARYANGILLVQVKDATGKILTNSKLIKN